MVHPARPVALWSTLLLLLPSLVAALPASDESQRLQRRANDGFIETLTNDQINLVKARLQESAVGSWENGTRAQALLEYDYPMLSVFYNPSIPIVPGHVPTESNTIAEITIAQRPADTLMFCEDGSAADPASLGISILLANATMPGVNYMSAVDDQNRWLFEVAPRTSDGAVSHRVSEVQLWSDFMAMVPPYLAYYGALMRNDSVTQAAYDQCRLYRQYMTNGTGLWRHILLGNEEMQDPGYWATGNAWAAWGMLRVLSTFMHSQTYSDRMEAQKADLKAWILEILNASYAQIDTATGLLPNYFSASSTFGEASSTALMASVSYRLAQLDIDTSTLPFADMARHAVFDRIDGETGWLAPVVNPLDWSRQGEHSSEGQSFTLLLAASYRDYNNATGQTAPPNRTGDNSAAGRTTVPGMLALLATTVAVAMAGVLAGNIW